MDGGKTRKMGMLVRDCRPVVLLLSIVASLTFSAGLAYAEPPRLVPDGQFESEGALGVAVDNSSSGSDASRGDVYVADFATFRAGGLVFGRVNKFDGMGSLLPPSPFQEVARAYSGVAASPVTEVVYALDAIASEIDEFDPQSGQLLRSFSLGENASGNGFLRTTTVEIATDSAGNVYVPAVPKNRVVEYNENGEEVRAFTGGSGAAALRGPTGVAIDGGGNLWVADAGNQRIEELTPSDEPVAHGEIPAEGVQSVALDAQANVFAVVRNFADPCGGVVPPCSHLVEYGPAHTQIADVGAGTFESRSLGALPDMLAVSQPTGRVYVTEGLVFPPEGVHGRVFIYAPPVEPKLENEFAAEVGTSEAKLGAVVNPGGISTAYRFEYGATISYGQSVPSPEGDTGGGFQPRTVWAGAHGLQPGTLYHYRIILTSPLGSEIVGADHTFTTETAGQASCPNEQVRIGLSKNLPDCRAYELVTPPNKTSAEADPNEVVNDVEAAFVGNFAAVDGNRFSFNEEDVLPGSKSAAKSYLATRGATGWSAENVFPLTNYYGFECPTRLGASAYSADLSKTVVGVEPVGAPCGLTRELVSGEPPGVRNLFVRDNTIGAYSLIDLPFHEVMPSGPRFVGASRDLDHIVFGDEAKLTEDATAGAENLYEWSGGALRLPMKLADGTPVDGSFNGFSPDGSHAFFTFEGKLYSRSHGAETVQLDASQAGGSGGGGSLVSASADGSQALISDDAAAELTSDTVPGSDINLYKYDFATGRLTDLTPTGHVELQHVLGVSEDDSYIYFEALGGFAPGATQGHANVYLWHAGTVMYLAGVVREPSVSNLEVSPNGLFLSFASVQSLTGYGNTDAISGSPDEEFYVYSAASNSITCATCNPSGAPPAGGPRREGGRQGTARNLSENGRFIFETSEALLPADTNGKQDVYEFEPYGVGSCGEPGGCVFLISTGTGTQDTWFIEAGPSGDDVFLREDQKLVPRDSVEEMHTIYDVRVDGGFSEPGAPPACENPDACRTPVSLQPPIFGAPASQTFSGAGNLVTPAPAVSPPVIPKPKPKKCKKGYVKKKNKCVKAKAKKGKRARTTNGKGRR